jgi:HPt (histidine-containing phosphotransfer) domain-containing protein
MAEPVFDPAVVAQLREDLSPEDLREVARLVARDAETMLSALEGAVMTRDEEGWKRAAHRLAGGVGGVGAASVEAAARRAMAQGLADAEVQLAALRQQLAALLAALDREFGL